MSILDKPWWYLLLWFIPIVNVGFAAKNSSFSSIEEDFFRLGIYSCDCHVQIGRLFHSIWPVQIGSNFSSSHFSPYSRIRRKSIHSTPNDSIEFLSRRERTFLVISRRKTTFGRSFIDHYRFSSFLFSSDVCTFSFSNFTYKTKEKQTKCRKLFRTNELYAVSIAVVVDVC